MIYSISYMQVMYMQELSLYTIRPYIPYLFAHSHSVSPSCQLFFPCLHHNFLFTFASIAQNKHHVLKWKCSFADLRKPFHASLSAHFCMSVFWTVVLSIFCSYRPVSHAKLVFCSYRPASHAKLVFCSYRSASHAKLVFRSYNLFPMQNLYSVLIDLFPKQNLYSVLIDLIPMQNLYSVLIDLFPKQNLRESESE